MNLLIEGGGGSFAAMPRSIGASAEAIAAVDAPVRNFEEGRLQAARFDHLMAALQDAARRLNAVRCTGRC